MVKKQTQDDVQDDLEITNDTETADTIEPELTEIEAAEENKIKTLQTKLKAAEEKQRQSHEELQRAKADFLNAKRRLEEERVRDKERTVTQHIEKLLPLCDSFYLAMLDKAVWEKADPIWRKGIEGIYAQLMSVLTGYGVQAVDPTGQTFDPHRHEALSMTPVANEAEHNQILGVVQLGYERTADTETIIIRPARVMVAEYTPEANS